MNPLADLILERIRQATTAGEIERIADEHRAEVMAMKATDTARHNHIVNAKAYYLKQMRG